MVQLAVGRTLDRTDLEDHREVEGRAVGAVGGGGAGPRAEPRLERDDGEAITASSEPVERNSRREAWPAQYTMLRLLMKLSLE